MPASASAFARASWDDLAPLYEELVERPLTEDTLDTWLEDWSRLEAMLTEAASLAMIAYTCDTADGQKRADHLRFSSEILPKVEEQSVALARRLIESGHSDPQLATVIRRFRTQIDIFREANVPIYSQLEGLNSQYHEVTGGLMVAWEGEELPLPRLQPFLKSPERAVRERAFRAVTGAYLSVKQPLASLFDRMFRLRRELARNAGFEDYQAYAFQSRFRFDYTPDDCARFHEAVAETVVPAVRRIYDARRASLGVDRLRPWDLGVDPLGRPPIRPFETAEEMADKAARVFHSIAPELGSQFQTMIDERLLDLESRKGKAPGGYCDTLHDRGRPFIFMNAAGVMDDVRTLLHEAGHCFHAFASHPLPFVWQRYPGAEIAELASMSMELLAAPRLAMTDGFLTEADARRAWVEQLEDILLTITHVAAVDAFQAWIYTSGEGHVAEARDEAWLRIRDRFEPGVDWTGLEAERISRWYRQLHIFVYPFYYIEYGIAQLGALQVWQNSTRDWADAVRQYRAALAVGSTTSLRDMYRTAGADVVFDAEGMAPLVAAVEAELEAYRD